MEHFLPRRICSIFPNNLKTIEMQKLFFNIRKFGLFIEKDAMF